MRPEEQWECAGIRSVHPQVSAPWRLHVWPVEGAVTGKINAFSHIQGINAEWNLGQNRRVSWNIWEGWKVWDEFRRWKHAHKPWQTNLTLTNRFPSLHCLVSLWLVADKIRFVLLRQPYWAKFAKRNGFLLSLAFSSAKKMYKPLLYCLRLIDGLSWFLSARLSASSIYNQSSISFPQGVLKKFSLPFTSFHNEHPLSLPNCCSVFSTLYLSGYSSLSLRIQQMHVPLCWSTKETPSSQLKFSRILRHVTHSVHNGSKLVCHFLSHQIIFRSHRGRSIISKCASTSVCVCEAVGAALCACDNMCVRMSGSALLSGV